MYQEHIFPKKKIRAKKCVIRVIPFIFNGLTRHKGVINVSLLVIVSSVIYLINPQVYRVVQVAKLRVITGGT